MKNVLLAAGTLAATTIGAGVFALPYITKESGWVIALTHLVILSAVLGWTHVLYLRTLEKTGGEKYLLALSWDYLKRARWFPFVVIIGELFLALVVYLVLARDFIAVLFPTVPRAASSFIFWVLGTAPFVLRVRLSRLEILGTVLMVGLIALVFLVGVYFWAPQETIPSANFSRAFFPFGVTLFALAGWTALEPIYRLQKEKPGPPRYGKAVFLATVLVVVVYILFVLGVFGLGGTVTPDALTGVKEAAPLIAGVLAVFGLLAMWTSYVPIGYEIVNLFTRDAHWGAKQSVFLAAALPLALVSFGLDDFIGVIGLAGGVFAAIQYALLLKVSERAVIVTKKGKLFANAVLALFLLAAAYEIYYFLK